MHLHELQPGWRTDFILHRHGALVVDAELAHWRARFAQAISALQPAPQHEAIGIYESLGCERRGRACCLQRTAPQDRPGP